MNGIQNKQVIARASHLAVILPFIISSTIHPNEKLQAGTFMAKMANNKYRAYAEGQVDVAFGTASAAFTLDPAGPLVKHFRVGDAIESSAGVLLGTILTFNSVTGAGTLTVNSAAVLAIDGRARISEASASLGYGKGRLLDSVYDVAAGDVAASGYVEGYMATTTLTTAAAIAKVGVSHESDEFKMKL